MTNRVTKAQLQTQVEALRHNAQLLETEIERLRAELAARNERDTTIKGQQASLIEVLATEYVAASGRDLAHEADLRAQRKQQLRADVAADEGEVAKPLAAPVERKIPTLKMAPRTTRPVFEFNPLIPGDFVRAAKLAREFKGCTRRCA